MDTQLCCDRKVQQNMHLDFVLPKLKTLSTFKWFISPLAQS